MRRKERYEYVLSYFSSQMPVATTELEFASPFQLLVATMLSAQCTDKRVNMVTPDLFRQFPDAKSMADTTPEEVYEYIRSVSYPNAKAAHLVDMARLLMSNFQGEVPREMNELTSLPGVGRKTANVVRAVAFGLPAMPVDTHVYRVSHRLGLVARNADTPQKVEEELLRNIPSDLVSTAHHWLILHGRYICKSTSPQCGECPFDNVCPKIMKGSKLR
ncbi:MAG: endonuclease III [Prevotella sp.]|nr:endonuclease III [Prevotella sp.]